MTQESMMDPLVRRALITEYHARLSPAMVRYAFARTGDWNWAEDAVQDVWTTLSDPRKDLQQIKNVQAFAFKLLRDAIALERRKRSRSPSFLVDEPLALGKNPEEELIEAESPQELAKAIVQVHLAPDFPERFERLLAILPGSGNDNAVLAARLSMFDHQYDDPRYVGSTKNSLRRWVWDHGYDRPEYLTDLTWSSWRVILEGMYKASSDVIEDAWPRSRWALATLRVGLRLVRQTVRLAFASEEWWLAEVAATWFEVLARTKEEERAEVFVCLSDMLLTFPPRPFYFEIQGELLKGLEMARRAGTDDPIMEQVWQHFRSTNTQNGEAAPFQILHIRQWPD